jgi:ribose/xylose/arabinose/galactoside ABC-type transport system permease subunit
MLIYASMLISAFILASIIYRYDIYDKEPWYLLTLVFFFGMAACWACGFVEDIIIVKFRLDDSIAGMAVNAALVPGSRQSSSRREVTWSCLLFSKMLIHYMYKNLLDCLP